MQRGPYHGKAKRRLSELKGTAMKLKTWMCWSSGKDSAFALYELKQRRNVEICGLLTTVTQGYDRVSMHGVRRALLEAQARAMKLPLEIVEIPSVCSNHDYESRMAEAIRKARSQQVTHMAFGDLYLQDVREYRERQLRGTGISPFFPLWHRPTEEMSREIIESGTKAILSCVDTRKLDASFSGREFDDRLLSELPQNIDPCGERGEFHTFVYDSPVFESPIPVSVGEKTIREGFAFTDILSLAERPRALAV